MISNEFWGVFSPKGTLEAVEGSRAMADFSAINLSPTYKGNKQLNRTVRPVIVLDESSLADIVVEVMTASAAKVYAAATDKANQSASDLADDKEYAAKNKTHLGADTWQPAHRAEQARMAAYRIVAATLEIKLNEG